MKFLIEHSDKRNEYLHDLLNRQDYPAGKFSFEDAAGVSEDDILIFSPARRFTSFEVENIPKCRRIYLGNLSDENKQILKNKGIDFVSFLSDEEFVYLNAVLTAEGVLAEIIKQTDFSIYEQKILLIGAGKVGKAIAALFGKLGLDFCMATRNIEIYNSSCLFTKKCYLGDDYKNDLGEFDIIINSVPAKIIEDELLGKIKKDAVVLETASVDCLDKTKVSGFKYIVLPGLPMVYSYKSAAGLMKKSILKEKDRDL